MKRILSIIFFMLVVTRAHSYGGTLYDVSVPATSGDGNITISWSVTPDDDIAQCDHVEIGLSFNSDIVQFESLDCTQTSYTFSNLESGQYTIDLLSFVYVPDMGSVELDTWLNFNIEVTNSGTQAPVELSPLSFENGIADWIQTGSYQWLNRSGGTSSSYTGPSSAAEGNWYAYMETSSGYAYNDGDTAVLVSPEFILPPYNSLKLNFEYHMYGTNIGTLYIDILDNGEWQTIWRRTGQQQRSYTENWNKVTIPLTKAPTSVTTKLRYRAVAKGGYMGDIAIDNIRIDEEGYETTRKRRISYIHTDVLGSPIAETSH
ncbi:hypothetical protein C2869_11170 [Saccharobesus litoralis]|uniref:MAM domain-containing protein n=1 Tax=Saccharobesus litoralis TaxID=2172099 RepID=A0A2S0VRY9_9ALTE|nr:hypothetical protein [Saccharobesus litoralis]AWB66963.1 hypothetical protein C2869_11170 [Saccharobesus litoralis]